MNPSITFRRFTFALWVLAALFATLTRAAENYAPFRPDLPEGAAYRIDAAQLHPTQFALGWREVVFKKKTIDAKSASELVAYLQDKDVPIVIGPGGVPYMTDGHHTLRALLEAKTADKTAFGHVLANWAKAEPAVFWRQMQERNYTYLKDAEGVGPQAPAALPATLLKMQLDPCRGLAWGVMKAGGFAEKKGVFFQEFLWGDFFRTRVKWDDRDEAAFARAVKEAVALAHTPAAAALPGYTPAVK